MICPLRARYAPSVRTSSGVKVMVYGKTTDDDDDLG